MGAKPGRMKGNKQIAKYQKPEKKHGKPGGREGGKRETERKNRSIVEATVRRKQEEGNGRNRG